MKRFLLIIGAVLIIGIGYFTYQKWKWEANLSVWSFVPANSVLIYESESPLTPLKQLQKTDIWKTLSGIEGLNRISETVNLLDTLAGKGNFRNFFQQNKTLISLNVTSRTDFDFLYILEINSLSQQTYISKALANFRDNGYKKKNREYLDFTITEIRDPKTDKNFTYIYYKNYFIGSFTAFLVEDAIRAIADRDLGGFNDQNPELHTITKLEKDQGNVYLNFNRLSFIINLFVKNHIDLSFAKSAFLDLKINDEVINMNGFTFADQPSHFLSNFKKSKGGTFDMAQIIPNETSWMYHFTTVNPKELGNSLNQYFEKYVPAVRKTQQKLLSDYDFDVNYTFSLIDQEIGLVTLESPVTDTQAKLLILEIKDIGGALSYLNAIGEKEAAKKQDSVFTEAFGNYQIRMLPAPEFPYALLGEIAAGFKEVYYLQFRNYLVFSNHLPQLKNFTISIENEDTWNKSLRVNRFIEKTNKEANFSLYLNTARVWKQFTKQLNEDWGPHFNTYSQPYKNLEFVALQFSTVDDKFYTNITLYQPQAPQNKPIEQTSTPLKSLTLPEPVTTKPWLVTNHSTREKEVFVQDLSKTVYQISKNFEVIWSKKLSEEINSPVQQIDYYNNGKLQVIFTTPSAVHIIDRTGEYIPEFPKSLPEHKSIRHFSLIDYDNTKRYRYGISTASGEAYLTDKNVQPLTGWAPKTFDSPLVQAPTHVRINGKDIIIVLQENGKLNLLNRRGGDYDQFPKDFGKPIEKPLFIKKQNTFSKSNLILVTKEGELLDITFDGTIKKREQLYKPAATTRFSLLEDVTGGSYLILRLTGNKYEILEDSKLLFQKDYLNTQNLYAQYYQLGGGSEFVVLVDPIGRYLYLYDKSGNLITGNPLAATQPVSIMKYENEYQIYRALGQKLDLISIDL